MFEGYYHGRRVFVTGHTGFKGSWLSLWLKHLGALVHGYSLAPPTNPNLHELVGSHALKGETIGNVLQMDQLERAVRDAKPDLVLHLAAQPLVRRSYAEPVETFATNALGTAHVLEVVRRLRLRANVIVVTSDKCYENREWEHGYRETDTLGGHDVYSMSKASAELVRESWYRAFFAGDSRLGHVAGARAGNVIGGGDYAEDRLLPDCVRALIKHKPIPVRNPASVRAWLHVLDCLSGYLWLGARLGREPKGGPLACAFNFGPEGDACQSAQALVKEVLKHWPGEWRDISDPAQVHEARVLKLCTDRAWALLNWRPTLCFEDSVELAMTWYRRRHAGPPTDMLEFSLRQIEDYCAKATTRMLPWADAPR